MVSAPNTPHSSRGWHGGIWNDYGAGQYAARLDGGARNGPAFAVYDLTECRAVARLVYLAPSRRSAHVWAMRWCSLTGRRLDCRNVFHAATGRLSGAEGARRGP